MTPSSEAGDFVPISNGCQFFQRLRRESGSRRVWAEKEVDASGSMECGGVDQREVGVSRAKKQGDLGASQDNAVSAALAQAVNDIKVDLAGFRADDALAELGVDDVVDLGPAGLVRDKGVKAKTVSQAVAIESSFHGIAGREQHRADGACPAESGACGVSDVQEREAGQMLDLGVQAMHGVGAEQDGLCAGVSQAFASFAEDSGEGVPVARSLAGSDVGEVGGPEQEGRGV